MLDRTELIKSVRKDLKMNQADFGRMLGVTSTMISKYEHGVNVFEDSKIFELRYFYMWNHKDWQKVGEIMKPFEDEIRRGRM